LKVWGVAKRTLANDVPQSRHDKLDTRLGDHCPLKIWESKKRPKFGLIWANFGL